MDFAQHSYKVLIVSSSDKFVRPMLDMLPEKMFEPIETASDVAQARRKLLEREFDIVIINSPLRDEFGTKLALDICQKSSAGVLLFVKAEHYSDITSKVMQYGVLAVYDNAIRSDALLNERATEDNGKEKRLGRRKNRRNPNSKQGKMPFDRTA